ncbi:murein biosynthesis integral membrane protein MurJ [Thermosulfurimonas marina]|uniref:Probable lipid II flippase MurJ n=1 Tax=Thermosulfurimonas marina TaxID=2047767 RepID=A0A6H1WUC3_9BACT|nr:murein biosynthesis integral membrane protein MurJ [Thermosulfurimonas marina]QJA06706.1 murein biosynthesis integral membrane protein MurJ [Thermosulfurimonas marina]
MRSRRRRPENSGQKIARRARSVTAAVILSRLLGLVREQVLAAFLGAGREMDAFVVGYRIPNLLRDLFAEGALGMAFTRVFSATREREGEDAAFEAAREALTVFGILVLMVVLLGEILAPHLVGLIAPDFKNLPEKFSLSVLLTRIMWPFLFFISLSAILAGMLNTFGVFFWPAASSALFNLSAIVGGLVLYFFFPSLGLPPVAGFATGVLLGGALQMGFNGFFLARKGFSFRLRPAFSSPAVKETLRLVGPSVLGLSAVQINVFLNTYFATSCGEGAVSWLAYAFRLMYVPLGLFGVGLSLALLPTASREVARGDQRALRESFSSSLLVGLSLSLPSAAGLVILSEPIVRLIFEHGRFLPSDTLHTAQALSFFALGLPFYGATKVMVPVYYALGNTLIPALSSVLAVGVNLLVILLTLPLLNFKAIALGTAVSLAAQSIFLLIFLRAQIPGLIPRKFLLGLFKILTKTLLMGGLAFILRERWPIWILIPLCGAFFLLLARLMGPEEALYFWRLGMRSRESSQRSS